MDFSIVQDAFAQGQAASNQPSLFESMLPLIILFFLMYLLLIRPQAKKAREQQSFISAMKPGDEVVTSSGIIGRIKTVNETFASVDVGCGNIKVLKQHITGPAQVAGKKA